MRSFEVHCTVDETKLYDVLTMLEPLATEIVSVPIKSKSRALTPVIAKHKYDKSTAMRELEKEGVISSPRGNRTKLILAYIHQHPKFLRSEINEFLAKKNVARADPVLAKLIDQGVIRKVSVGSYELMGRVDG